MLKAHTSTESAGPGLLSRQHFLHRDGAVKRASGIRFRWCLTRVFLIAALTTAFLPLTGLGQDPIELKGHEEVVYDATFLPDGKSIVTASFDQTLKLWDLESQTVLRTMEGHTGIVLTVDVSPDGQQIASGGSDRSIRLWDVPQRAPVSSTRIHEAAVQAVATTRNGLLTATADALGNIRIWKTGEDGSEIDGPTPGFQQHLTEVSVGIPVTRLAWRIDNQKLAAGCSDGSVRIISLNPDSNAIEARIEAHDGAVTGVVFSSSNRFMLTSGADGYVRRWPVQITPSLHFEALEKAASAVAVHPNGSLIAVVGENGAAQILKRSDGAIAHKLEGHTGSVTAATFNRAGSHLATLGSDNVARVFEVSSGKLLHQSPPAKSPLTAVLFTSDGKELILGTERGDVLSCSLNESPEFRSLSKRPEAVRAVALTSDSSRIFYGGDGQRLWIREAATEKTARAASFDANISAIAVSANNSTIAVGLDSGTIATLDASTFEQTSLLEGGGKAISRLQFNTTGTHLASLSTAGRIRVWDLNAQAIAQSFSNETNPITDIVLQSDNKSIITSHADGQVHVETVDAQLVHQADEGPVHDLSLAANASQYATAGEDGIVKLWNASNSTPTRSFTGLEGPALSVSLSPDNRQIAARGNDSTVRTWNISNASGYFQFNVNASPARLEFSPDSSRLITALSDGTLQCFDPTPLNPQPAEPPGRDASQVLQGHPAGIIDLAWTPDSQTLRTGGADSVIHEWSIASPKVKATLTGHGQQVYSVVYSPDGKTLASASADKTVRLWDLEKFKAIRTLVTLSAPVYSLAFSTDGKQLAIAGADNTVRLLDVDSGKEIRQFEGPEHPVYSVAISPDGQQIAAAGMGLGAERSVYLWSVESSEPVSVWSGHQDDIYRTQFNATGSRLLTVGYAGSVQIRDLTSGQTVFEKDLNVVTYSGMLSPDGSSIVATGNDRTARVFSIPENVR